METLGIIEVCFGAMRLGTVSSSLFLYGITAVLFENRVLRRISGPKRDEVTGEWRKLHNEEPNGLYSVTNIVRVIKSRRLRWAGHVARMWEGRAVYKVLVGKPE
jgi:hypothetical protein